MDIAISFLKPYFLSFIIILPVFVFVYLKSSQRDKGLTESIALYLRLIAITMLVFALARPVLNQLDNNMNIMILADRSGSLTSEMKEKERNFIKQLIKEKRNDDRLGLITLAKEAMVEFMPGRETEFSGFNSYIDSNFTNIEEGLDLALSLMPSAGNKRVVLLSDGNENIGNAETLISDYTEKDVKIDVLPLVEEDLSEVFIKDINLPEWVDPGEKFNIHLNISSTYQSKARLNLYYDDKLVRDEMISLDEGDNIFLVEQQLSIGGFHKYRVEISAEKDTYTQNNSRESFVIVKGSKRVLLLSDNRQYVNRFINTIESEDINIDLKSPNMFSFGLEELQIYDSVILNNIPANLLSTKQMDNIYKYVHELCGGLLVIGGKSTYGAGNYNETQLNNILPLNSNLKSKTVIPETSLLVVLDKSGSMDVGVGMSGETNRLDLAKEATLAILDILEQEENFGIIAFDDRPQIVYPIQKVNDKRGVVEEISVFAPSGGTDIYSALDKAKAMLQEEKSTIKHVILLSDGHSKNSRFEELITSMVTEGITVSSVAVGGEVDTILMSQLAEWGGGRYYYTNDADKIPQIFVDEAKRIVRNPIIEKDVTVSVINHPDFLAEVDFSTMPLLNGYIATTPKPLADVYLISEEKFPILAGWRYGLGKVISYTADMGGEFSVDWLNWQEYPLFWSSIVKQLVRDSYSDNIFPYVSRSGDRGIILVDGITDSGDYYNFLDMEAKITTSDNVINTIKLEQVGPGLYKGEFDIQGEDSYIVSLNWQQDSQEKTLSTGLVVSYSTEYRNFSSENSLIKSLTEGTGGQIINSTNDIYSTRELSFAGEEEIWPKLVTLALLFFLLDIATRIIDITVVKRIWDSFTGFVKIKVSEVLGK